MGKRFRKQGHYDNLEKKLQEQIEKDAQDLGKHYYLSNHIEQEIGWAFWDYYPNSPTQDKVFKYMKKYSLEWAIRERYQRDNQDSIIIIIEETIIAGEPFGLYISSEKNAFVTEVMIHYGCASVNAFWLAKKGLRGFKRIAELTHAGDKEQQKKRANFMYKFCKDRYLGGFLK